MWFFLCICGKVRKMDPILMLDNCWSYSSFEVFLPEHTTSMLVWKWVTQNASCFQVSIVKSEETKVRQEDLSKLLYEVQLLRTQQDNMECQMQDMKQWVQDVWVCVSVWVCVGLCGSVRTDITSPAPSWFWFVIVTEATLFQKFNRFLGKRDFSAAENKNTQLQTIRTNVLKKVPFDSKPEVSDTRFSPVWTGASDVLQNHFVYFTVGAKTTFVDYYSHKHV